MSYDKQTDPENDNQDNNLKVAYEQVCNSYRAIDDFRAKLLGLLPLVSGAGIFLLLNDVLTDQEKSKIAVEFLLLISIFGFVVTLGLFFYEIHGIKKCGHLINVGQEIERKLRIEGLFLNRPRDVAGFINEPFAASIIYPAVLAAWLFVALYGIVPGWAGVTITAVIFFGGAAGSFKLQFNVNVEQ